MSEEQYTEQVISICKSVLGFLAAAFVGVVTYVVTKFDELEAREMLVPAVILLLLLAVVFVGVFAFLVTKLIILSILRRS